MITSADADVSVYAGGFAGQVGGTKDASAVSACYARGGCDVNGLAAVDCGGLVGELRQGEIDSCFANGGILSAFAAEARCGGFAGSVSAGTVGNCYAVNGSVAASGSNAAEAGAFAGTAVGTVTHVYACLHEVRKTQGDSFPEFPVRTVIDGEAAAQSDLNSGGHLAGFDFDSAARKWCYLAGVNGNFPVLTALEGWDAWPDFAMLRQQGLSELSVADAAQLGTAARLLNDAGFAGLLSNGRAARGALTVDLCADVSLEGKIWNPILQLKAGDVLDGQDRTLSGLRSDAERYENYGLVRTNNGVIQNLTVSNAAVTAGSTAGLVDGTNGGVIENVTVQSYTLTGVGSVGAVAGVNGGILRNISVLADATVRAPIAGGIAGTNTGVIQNSDTVSAEDQIQGTTSSGRIVGDGAAAEENCREGQCAAPQGHTAGVQIFRFSARYAVLRDGRRDDLLHAGRNGADDDRGRVHRTF